MGQPLYEIVKEMAAQSKRAANMSGRIDAAFGPLKEEVESDEETKETKARLEESDRASNLSRVKDIDSRLKEPAEEKAGGKGALVKLLYERKVSFN